MSGRDLGTYHLRVQFTDGTGYIEEWATGARYGGGRGNASPLDAKVILPTWKDEQDVFHGMIWAYTEGNFGCDCNKSLMLARAYQQPEPEETVCGETMTIESLTAIRPDGTEEVIYSGVKH